MYVVRAQHQAEVTSGSYLFNVSTDRLPTLNSAVLMPRVALSSKNVYNDEDTEKHIMRLSVFIQEVLIKTSQRGDSEG